MKTFVAATALAVAILASPTLVRPAAAADWRVGLGAGLTAPFSELDESYDKSHSFEVVVNGPLPFRVLDGRLGFRADLSRDAFDPGDEFKQRCRLLGEVCDARFLNFTGGVQYDGRSWHRLDPYLFFTAGGYHFDSEIRLDDGDLRFGLGFGAGFDFRLAPAWGVGLEARFNYVADGDDAVGGVWYMVPSAVVSFRR